MQVNNNKPVSYREGFRRVRENFPRTIRRRRGVVSLNPTGEGRAPMNCGKVVAAVSNFMWRLVQEFPRSVKRRADN